MSKRRHYQNMPATDAPQQKPGTEHQAQTTQEHIDAALHAEPGHLVFRKANRAGHRGHVGEEGPEFIDDIEMP
jgi:hypothetical protein